MVITVRRGMASPSTGTLAIHCCAAMLGLQLEKDLPNNVLLVHGMRKINDISLGRKYLVDAFRSFGDIEAAAIAPCNRGFGECAGFRDGFAPPIAHCAIVNAPSFTPMLSSSW
jgi:hypothetical protein